MEDLQYAEENQGYQAALATAVIKCHLMMIWDLPPSHCTHWAGNIVLDQTRQLQSFVYIYVLGFPAALPYRDVRHCKFRHFRCYSISLGSTVGVCSNPTVNITFRYVHCTDTLLLQWPTCHEHIPHLFWMGSSLSIWARPEPSPWVTYSLELIQVFGRLEKHSSFWHTFSGLKKRLKRPICPLLALAIHSIARAAP